MAAHPRARRLQAIPIASVLASTDSSAVIVMEFGAPLPVTSPEYVTYCIDTDEETSSHLSQITSAITNAKRLGQHCEA